MSDIATVHTDDVRWYADTFGRVVDNVESAVLEAEREANGSFRDVGDLARRATVSRDALEALVRGGACDCLGPRRRDLGQRRRHRGAGAGR